jgi:hypothetical protein
MDPPASNTQDFLLQNIKSSRDTTQVLQIVGLHHKIMNTRHVMQSLECLFDLKKSGKLVFNSLLTVIVGKTDSLIIPDVFKLALFINHQVSLKDPLLNKFKK